MQDYFPLMVGGALLLSGGSIVAWVKFWMDAGKSRQQADQAVGAAAAAVAKCELLSSKVTDYQTETARTYATVVALGDAERRLAAAVEGIRTDFRGVAERFDKILLELVRERNNG